MKHVALYFLTSFQKLRTLNLRAKAIAELISVNADLVITVDPHKNHILDFFTTTAKSCTAVPEIANYLKGQPDLIVLRKIPNSKYNLALVSEAKTSKGRLTQGQKNFAKDVNLVVFKSFEDFNKELEEFLNNELKNDK